MKIRSPFQDIFQPIDKRTSRRISVGLNESKEELRSIDLPATRELHISPELWKRAWQGTQVHATIK
jgi:hypothetical protein